MEASPAGTLPFSHPVQVTLHSCAGPESERLPRGLSCCLRSSRWMSFSRPRHEQLFSHGRVWLFLWCFSLPDLGEAVTPGWVVPPAMTLPRARFVVARQPSGSALAGMRFTSDQGPGLGKAAE